MGRVYHFCSGDDDQLVSAANFRYAQPFGILAHNATESNCQMIMRTAGTISNLEVLVGDNTLNGSATVTVRVNGTDTGLTTTVAPAATIGYFVDDTNTATVAAGDKVSLIITAGGSTGSIGCDFVRTVFTASNTSDTVTRLTCGGPEAGAGVTYTTASTTAYNVLNGVMRSSVTTESITKCRQRRRGTMKNLAVRVRTNTRSTSTVIRLRKNGADGNQVITVTAGTTGWLEDITNTDTVAAGDDFNYSLTTGTGTGNFVVDYIAVDYLSLDGYGQLIVNGSGTGNVQRSQIRDWRIAGHRITSSLGLIHIQEKIPTGVELAFSDLTIHLSSNNVDTDSTIKFRRNNADANQVAIIPANTTGVFSDIENLDIASGGDLINYRVTAGTGGISDFLGVEMVSCWTFDAASVPTTAVKAECDAAGMEVAGEFYLDFTTADHVQRQTVWFTLSA